MECAAARSGERAARDFDLGGGFHYSGSYPMVFQHSGAQDFDLGGGFVTTQVVTRPDSDPMVNGVSICYCFIFQHYSRVDKCGPNPMYHDVRY